VKTETFGRVSATSPGKHGARDWRVTIGGVAPTHAEIVFLVGMVLLAEQRYSSRTDMGPYMLFYWLDQLCPQKTPERIRELAEGAAESVTQRTKPGVAA
jgi:hypothetical protein